VNGLKLWYVLAFYISILVTPAAYAQSKVSLTLTYPAGKSPNVFTEGWVFGARAIADPRGPTERDVSSTVRWTGSGTFHPAVGKTSRPIFAGPGPNSIILSVTVDWQTVTEQVSVNAVNSLLGGMPLYAALRDLAHSPADGHGQVAGPIISGSPNVTIRGLPAARKGTTGYMLPATGPIPSRSPKEIPMFSSTAVQRRASAIKRTTAAASGRLSVRSKHTTSCFRSPPPQSKRTGSHGSTQVKAIRLGSH
jgi:uncharacterized Zn-binding protein involved in type VI secretion